MASEERALEKNLEGISRNHNFIWFFCLTFWSFQQQIATSERKDLCCKDEVVGIGWLCISEQRMPAMSFASHWVNNDASFEKTWKGLPFKSSLMHKPDSYFCRVQNSFWRLHTNEINLTEITLFPTTSLLH